MVQLRWTDETIWKNAPWLRSIEQGEEEWQASLLKANGRKMPPGVEFREVPDIGINPLYEGNPIYG